MTPAAHVASIALAMALGLMLVELAVSRANERVFRQRGAVDAPDEVYPTMRWAYPAAFVVMALEGMLIAPAPGAVTWLGLAAFVAAKALKAWAVVSLRRCWTYRVLVLPGMPLVRTGPYRFLRHPNYVAVLGELVGMAMLTSARITGPLLTLFFAWLLRQRIADEERALSLPR